MGPRTINYLVNCLEIHAEKFVLAHITTNYVKRALKDIADFRDVAAVALVLASLPSNVRLKATAEAL